MHRAYLMGVHIRGVQFVGGRILQSVRRTHAFHRVCASYGRVTLVGVPLIGVHLMGVPLISIHLIGVYIMGVHLMGVYLMACILSGENAFSF